MDRLRLSRLGRGWLLFGLVFGLVSLIGGCSGDGTVAVYGTVSFAGREVPQVARVFFKPIESAGPSRPSSSDIAADGTYRVRAFKDSTGLVPGTYLVSITYYDLKPGANPDLESSWQEANYDAGQLEIPAAGGEIEHNLEVPDNSREATP